MSADGSRLQSCGLQPGCSIPVIEVPSPQKRAYPFPGCSKETSWTTTIHRVSHFLNCPKDPGMKGQPFGAISKIGDNGKNQRVKRLALDTELQPDPGNLAEPWPPGHLGPTAETCISWRGTCSAAASALSFFREQQLRATHPPKVTWGKQQENLVAFCSPAKSLTFSGLIRKTH